MAVSNISVVLYVLALLYTIIFVISVWRTYKKVLKNKNYPNFQIFRWFYIILWVQLLLTSILNWALATQIYTAESEQTREDTLEVILFIYAPSIMMVITYTLIYYQMIFMFLLSKIRTAQRFHSRFTSPKLEKAFKIFTIGFMILFIATQIILLIVALFGTVKEINFEIQLGSFVAIMILIMNTNMLIQYFKHSGMPYKNDKFYKKVKYMGTIAGVWSVCFLLKFGFGIYGTQLYITTEKDTLGTAILIAAGAIICDMVPFLAIIDSKFIKIFSMSHLRDAEGRSAESLVEASEQGDIESTLDNSVNNSEINHSINSGAEQQNLLTTSALVDRVTSNELVHSSIQSEDIESRDTKKFKTKDYLLVSKRGPFTEQQNEKGRAQIEKKCMIQDESNFSVQDNFSLQWYPAGEKLRKNKLGSLNKCQVNIQSKDLEDGNMAADKYITRTMNFDRISSYQIDGYFNELTKMYLLKLKPWMVFPKAIHIDEKMTINVVMKKQVSLYQFMHDRDNLDAEMKEELQLSYGLKLHICIELAKILFTLHQMQPFIAHGHLTPHNIFIRIKDGDLRLRIGDTELSDLQKYANMFYSYKTVSVYSAPECLKQQKKLLDKTTQMDVYSLGMIMWELWHQETPFDNDLKDATNFVVKEEARPAISAESADGEDNDSDESESSQSDEEKPPKACTHNMAELIRICWQQDSNLRPDMMKVCQILHQELQTSAAIDSDDEDDQEKDNI